VPNARFAQEYIENISVREMIRYSPNIRLRNDTSKEVVEKVLVGLRILLEKHKKVDQKDTRVRFADFEDNALKLNIKAFIKTTDYNEYLQISEDLNLAILKIVKRAGTSLAVPFDKIQLASKTKN
jgi:MscS family membrane protein